MQNKQTAFTLHDYSVIRQFHYTSAHTHSTSSLRSQFAANYHQRFFCPSTSQCQAPRFSSRDPCPHAGVVSTRCSDNCALIARRTVDIGVVSNPSLASVSLPWLQPRAGSIHWLPLHHCCLDASLFHSRSTQSYSLPWASGNEIGKHLSLLKQLNELEAKKTVKHLKQL